jgi:hypothetical protein
VVQTDLDISRFVTYGKALAAQVAAGDGAGIDGTFRNSGVVIDEANGLYYAVNGVHPVNRGDFTSYYPKSISADDATWCLVDSQGPLFDGFSLFAIGWSDPCR